MRKWEFDLMLQHYDVSIGSSCILSITDLNTYTAYTNEVLSETNGNFETLFIYCIQRCLKILEMLLFDIIGCPKSGAVREDLPFPIHRCIANEGNNHPRPMFLLH